MATISFANLNADFHFTQIFYSLTQLQTATHFAYVNLPGNEVNLFGSGFTYLSGRPTAGIVASAEIDLGGDDALGEGDIVITGVTIAATSFNFSTGQQADRNWTLLLGGDDTFEFTQPIYDFNIEIAGDGDRPKFNPQGGNDHFTGASALLGQSSVSGDFANAAGPVFGGDDVIEIGAPFIYGDVGSAVSGVGGDDVIAPAAIAGGSQVLIDGDAGYVSESFTGGDDLIDLRSTDLTGHASISLMGDVLILAADATLVGGNDTIHGSSRNDGISGDSSWFEGSVLGGDDQLFGYGGKDVITGDGGADLMSGGEKSDYLFGGYGGDTMFGDAGADVGQGEGGDDLMFGGGGGDDFKGGNGDDLIDGGVRDDSLSGEKGVDTLRGGNGDDVLNGGADGDVLATGAGADTVVSAVGGGCDEILDFAAGVGVGDAILLSGFGAAFDSFAEVLAAAADDGFDTTIDFSGGDALVLRGVVVSDLAADDFQFG